MSKMIFVNLPVSDLPRAMRFYEALSFTNEPKFTDDTAACMVWSDSIFVMLLTHDKWRQFTQRPIPSAESCKVMLCLSCDSRDDVNRLAEIAGKSGGRSDIEPQQDHGFMMSRSIGDPDGHFWEFMWMDPAAAEQGPPAEGDTQ